MHFYLKLLLLRIVEYELWGQKHNDYGQQLTKSTVALIASAPGIFGNQSVMTGKLPVNTDV